METARIPVPEVLDPARAFTVEAARVAQARRA
jgi:hypothetical protein